jgi:hypothetical protein
MGIADRVLGKKNINGNPHIEAVQPGASLPGGEVRITGRALRPKELKRPQVRFGDREGAVVVSSDQFLVARVPQDASSGTIVVATNGHTSNAHEIKVASRIADNLHPVTNPAVDAEGNVYTTFSGSRGQKVPVAVFKIDTNYIAKPYLADLMNATAIVFDRAGKMYVSSRYDGAVYQVAPNGTMTAYAESMGVATGMAFDAAENLYVGDRSGTIFKIARDRQIFVFATIEPSVSAYHLTVGPKGDLFISGPTTSSFDAIYKVDPQGSVSTFYRGLGRPQGMAFDIDGNLYVAASLAGKRGIVKITPDGKASLQVSGHNLVGLAFAPGRAVALATTTGIYHLSWDIEGLPTTPQALV